MLEKRRYRRFLKELKISYTVLSKVDSTPFEFGNSITVDISRSGLSFLLDEALPVPILLQIQLRMPSRPYGIFVLGKTAHCKALEDIGMYRIGIKFVGILPPELETALNEVQAPTPRPPEQTS